MTTYYTTFGEVPIATGIPSILTVRTDGGTTTYSVANTGSQHYFRASVAPTTSVNDITWNAIDSDVNRANSEVLVKMRASSIDTAGIWFGGMTRLNTGTVSSRLYVGAKGYDNSHATSYDWLYRWYEGATTNIVAITYDVSSVLSANTWYWVRHRSNGTTISYKFWADGSSEPVSWTLSGTDSQITAAGGVGFEFAQESVTNTVTFDLAYLSVGTNGDTAPTVAPTANFIGNTTTINAGDSVKFTDTSTDYPYSWSWTFGDSGTSTSQNPIYTYSAAGTYSVQLTATNAAGSNSVVRTNYITVVNPSTVKGISSTTGLSSITT